MHVVLIILIIFCAILLVGVVLIQKSKGGGLSSAFAAGNQMLGVRHTNDVIEKITWWLAGALALLSVCTAFTMPKTANDTQIRSSVEAVPAAGQGQFSTEVPVEVPATETPATATETPATAVETPAPAAETPEQPGN